MPHATQEKALAMCKMLNSSGVDIGMTVRSVLECVHRLSLAVHARTCQTQRTLRTLFDWNTDHCMIDRLGTTEPPRPAKQPSITNISGPQVICMQANSISILLQFTALMRLVKRIDMLRQMLCISATSQFNYEQMHC